MHSVCFFERSSDFHGTICRYIAEDITLHSNCCDYNSNLITLVAMLIVRTILFYFYLFISLHYHIKFDEIRFLYQLHFYIRCEFS
jgi:hypothetical protein